MRIRNGLAMLAVGMLGVSLLALPGKASAEIKVFVCEPEWGALTKEIGGDKVSIYSGTTAMQDPHQVQARPSLIARLRNSQMLVCSGAQLEIGWLPVLMIQSANGGIQAGSPGYIMAGDHIPMLEIPAVADRVLGDVHPMGNPHVHTGPQNYIPVAKVIAERLSILDPANTDFYLARLKDFTQRWDAAMKRWLAQAAPLRGISVVSHHMYWVYLYDFLGIKQIGTLEPKPGVPPSVAHLNELLTQLRFTSAKMVVRTPYEDPQASQFLSEQVHIPQVVLPGTVGGTNGAKDLFGLFDDTISRLLDALNGKSDTSIAAQ